LVLILNDLIDFFNVGNSMNASQIVATSEIILQIYGQMNIDDFKLCFTNAKRGMYGQVYRIDGNVILSWIEKYLSERMNFAENRSYSQHLQNKSTERNDKLYTDYQ